LSNAFKCPFDKSTTCIHCGYPLNHEGKSALYCLRLNSIKGDENDFKVNRRETLKILKDFYHVQLENAIKLTESFPSDLIDGITSESLDFVSKQFEAVGCIIEFTPSKLHEYNNVNNKIKSVTNGGNPIICPHCFSTSVTTDKRGFSVFTGFIGANKTVNRCGNCGWRWEPLNRR